MKGELLYRFIPETDVPFLNITAAPYTTKHSYLLNADFVIMTALVEERCVTWRLNGTGIPAKEKDLSGSGVRVGKRSNVSKQSK
jgi:hypothetical protein